MATAMSEPAKAATGTAEIPRNASDRLKVIARTAPSAAPVETPRVNGVASGFRRRPWKTTPAEPKSAPTQAPASVRGSRAAEVDGRRADERRQQQRDHGQCAEAHDGADEAALQSHRRSGGLVRRIGTTTRWPEGCLSTSASTP